MQDPSEETYNLTTATEYQPNVTAPMDTDRYDPREVIQTPISIIRICLCSIGLVLNFLSVIAVAHIPYEFKTHVKLILSLAVSDSLTIVSVQFHYLKQLLELDSYCLVMWTQQVINLALYAALVNLLAMAADHYIAIMKPLRYPQIVTPFRANCVICLIWSVGMLVGLLDYFYALFTINANSQHSFCFRALLDEFDTQQIILFIVLVVFVIMTVVYVKIYLVVRRLVREHQSLTQDESHNYKAIVTTFLILGTFIFCWLPYNTYQIVNYIDYYTDGSFFNSDTDTQTAVYDLLLLLLSSNSLCDPIIYAVRLGQVQDGYKRMFFKYCPGYNRTVNEQYFRSVNHNHRRSTHIMTLVENDISGHPRRQLNISDTEISMIPLNTENKIGTAAEAKSLEYTDHYEEDNVTNLMDMEGEQKVDERENTSDIEEAKHGQETSKTTKSGTNEDDEKSSNTNVTPVSPVSEKDFSSDTENRVTRRLIRIQAV